jgi:cytochrome P450
MEYEMKTKLPPGPSGLPWLGNARLFIADPPGFLNQLVCEYGEITSFIAFGRRFYVVSSPDLVREVLITNKDAFSKADRDIDILSKFLGRGLLTAEGDYHKRQRKLVQPAFHSQRIQAYAETMVEYTDRLLESWCSGETRDLAEDMRTVTMTIVAKSLFDADRDTMAGTVERVGRAIEEIQDLSNIAFKAPFLVPEWLPVSSNRRTKAARAILDETINMIIARRRTTAAQSANGRIKDTGDLLSMLLLAQDEAGGTMTDAQVRDELVTLFIAGHETTSNALVWTWYLLSQDPEVEAQLHSEVDKVLNGRLPTLADLSNLPYTLMVIKEAMRLYPPAWVLNGRQAIADTTIGGYAIPHNSVIFIAPYTIHRRPHFFPNPERFDPERFQPAREKELPRYAYIPFGAGPRICIGNSFAMMEAHLIVATIGQRYRLRLAADQTITLNPQITLSNKGGMHMQIEARHSRKL